jgi:hypothetical protein
MSKPEYRLLGTSVTSTIDNNVRKELRVKPPKLYSQQFDLSDFIGMDPDTEEAICSVNYEIRDRHGRTLLAGKTDRYGETERVFTSEETEIMLYVGDGGWTLSMDCIHHNE